MKNKINQLENCRGCTNKPRYLALKKEMSCTECMMINKDKIKPKSSTEKIEDFKNLCRGWAQKQVKDGKIKSICSICEAVPNKSKNEIIVARHIRYSYPFTLEDLEMVCRYCHQKKHGRGIQSKTN